MFICVWVEVIVVYDCVKVGLWCGLLDGVVFSWKDNIDSVGIVIEVGLCLLVGCMLVCDVVILLGVML